LKGRSANDELATRYNKGIADAISSNFAHFGTQKETSLALEKITFNDYHFYASGRQNCLYALIKYDLKKRQCLFSSCTMEMIWTKKDLVHIEIPIKVPEYQLPDGAGASTSIPLEFMIARKKSLKEIYSQFAYLKNFVGAVNPTHFSTSDKQANGLVVLAESSEAANHLLNPQLGDVFSALADKYLDSVHISDQKAYNNYPLWFKATLYLDASSPQSLQETSKLLKALFVLVDRVVSLRLSKDTRAKAEKNRKAVEKIKQKEKAEEKEEATLAKKREEKLKF
jgi:hypothetical protein